MFNIQPVNNREGDSPLLAISEGASFQTPLQELPEPRTPGPTAYCGVGMQMAPRPNGELAVSYIAPAADPALRALITPGDVLTAYRQTPGEGPWQSVAGKDGMLGLNGDPRSMVELRFRSFYDGTERNLVVERGSFEEVVLPNGFTTLVQSAYGYSGCPVAHLPDGETVEPGATPLAIAGLAIPQTRIFP